VLRAIAHPAFACRSSVVRGCAETIARRLGRRAIIDHDAFVILARLRRDGAQRFVQQRHVMRGAGIRRDDNRNEGR
jgi:hypothetical protein